MKNIKNNLIKTLKSSFDTPYGKYDNVFKIGFIMIIICIITSVVSIQDNIDFPSWASMLIVITGLVGFVMCIFAGVQAWRLTFKRKNKLDERQKKNMGRAALYAMLITIILSFVIFLVINYSNIELSIRELVTIPLVILVVSYTIFFRYFNKNVLSP